jgi:sugar-specific transcriptional regulator TrmB
MVVASSKVMDSLKTIGLNKYERNLWVALLSRGSATAGELSDISNVPRSRCYDVLESLAERGFVVVQPGKPMKYVAIQPKEALARVQKKIQEEAVETSDKIDRLVKSEHIKELEKIHKDNIKTIKPEDMTGALKGRYAMLQQLETMMKNAKKSIKLMTTENGLVELTENHSNILKRASEAGVKIQVVAPVTKNTTEHAKTLSKYAQVRNMTDGENIANIVGRICVVDGNEFVLGLTDDAKTHPTQDVAVWTQSAHVTANLFEPLFEHIWTNSKPLKG